MSRPCCSGSSRGVSNSGISWKISGSWTFALPLSLRFFSASLCRWCSLEILCHVSAASASSLFLCSSGYSAPLAAWLLVVRAVLTSTFCFFKSGCGAKSWSSILFLSANPNDDLSNFHAARWQIRGIRIIGCWIVLLCCAHTLSNFW